MTNRQGLRQIHDAHVAATGVCTCTTGEPNPFFPGASIDPCRSLQEMNAAISLLIAALEGLGPPEPGEDKSRWRLR